MTIGALVLCTLIHWKLEAVKIPWSSVRGNSHIGHIDWQPEPLRLLGKCKNGFVLLYTDTSSLFYPAFEPHLAGDL